ncbi:UDP-glucose 6-dehydrogenase [Legionella hackeliae]|uniref:UDP-glucose dehydrogenase family protein n=1 Tax=Legionella hackeliae TaxID=449 RepID=UPI000E13320F|nr:UDP-glucose/GDP-mannose dehydrogenase family protein [Legionella hackeliae]STX47970.1 UDP-glucose 6-dehydrogenase [Legionella hackeliae]
MVISVYGAGYVGLVSAVCFAKLGHQVICADINEQKIALLLEGHCPIYENGLPELLHEQIQLKRLHFTADLAHAIKMAQVHIIATGTPSQADGSADLSQVFAVARQVAQEATSHGVLITKSTVPVGTGEAIQTLVNEELIACGKDITIEVASNPEFLREGTAVYDFLNADRIIIGGEEKALTILREIYQPLVEKGIPLLSMSRNSAELTKYSANAMLACRISFMNQISQIAEKFGANIDDIRQGIGMDPRIGSQFLQAGIGYGGSCFPKDVRALIQIAKSIDIDTNLLQAIDNVNNAQKKMDF